MSSDSAPTKKSSSNAANTPRQVSLVMPHATADAGVTFETALEVLDHDLQVHKLWQARPKSPGKRRSKTPA